MSSVQHLREFIRERLTAAAQEIFTEVEKTIICYEEELDAQRRMMGINWKPEIKLHRIGSELQRQSSDLQQPSISNEEEAPAIQQVWSLASRSSQDQKEAEPQWTEEEQMEPEPKWIKKEEEPEPALLKHEEIEFPLTYVKEEELEFSVHHPELQRPEHLPTGQNQKNLCSSQEGEQLVQKQFVALIETSTLQEDDMNEEERRTEQLSPHISPVVESKDQEGSSSSESESQAGTNAKKRSFKCEICGRCYTQQWNLKKHYRIHTDLQQSSVSNEEETSVIQQVCSLASRSSQDQKESEHQWTEEEQMEPEPKWIKKEEEPEPALLKLEEIEFPLMYVREEEVESSVHHPELQRPEHLPTGQNQKNLCSSQEGEQLVQKQFVALIETSTLQEDDMNEEERRTEQLSRCIYPVVESKDWEGSSSSESESQAGTRTKKRFFKCDICGRCYIQQCNLKKHDRIYTDLQQPSVSNEEEASVIQQVCSLASRSSQDQKESEHQWTEEEQMEPEPKWIKKEDEPEPALLKHEEIEFPLTYVREEEVESSVHQHELQPPEHLPTGQNQKNLCSSQEGEQLVQKQFAALIETSTLQEDDMNEEERRTEQLSRRISPVVESKDQEGSSSSVSESQAGTSAKKRSFKCDICGRCYIQQWNLKNHYKTHTDERPFSCESCGKSFLQNGDLITHKRIHTGEKPFSCESCSKSFTRIGDLRVHQKVHTGERPFSCEVCRKRFSRRSTLNVHKRIHTGEKPFSCKSCAKCFSQIGHLIAHNRIHTGEKPFPS
ncbi:zinc finger protein 675-like [Gambusia affinis]|uniref:zinc finger protein 675-like n=1 Tax=Gambusia affinis TaxID=33528 RepID=UPI001CDBF93B|nr:zinc finger protein 675-like [Gambusia affinis]